MQPKAIQRAWGGLWLAIFLLSAHGQAAACDAALIQQRLKSLGLQGLPHVERAVAVAGPFASSKVELLAHMPVSSFPGGGGSTDIWGYVSPSGREYAIIGLHEGTAFVEVSDPKNPAIIAFITHINACCSDVKTYKHHAYIVSEGSNIGMKVIDLGDIDNGNVVELATFTGAALKQAHNIAINEESGFAYICGGFNNPSLGGIMALDLRDPFMPRLAGFWSDQYVHDVQVVNYNSGPYAGREIAFAFSGFFTTRLRILDVTNKADIRVIGITDYPNAEFAHQGWLSDDRRYVYLNDEFDELNHGTTTSTHVIDVSDLTNPTYVQSFGSGLASTDHNLMVNGNVVYEANYTSGLRIFRAHTPSLVKQIGFFDSHPQSDDPGFNGAWGVYSKLPSGNILLSDIQNGLFILDPTEALAGAKPLPTTRTPGVLILTIALLAVGLAALTPVLGRQSGRRSRWAGPSPGSSPRDIPPPPQRPWGG